MTKFWLAIGDFFTSTFGPIETLGAMGFNMLLMGIGFVYFLYWLNEMRKFEKDEIKTV